MELISIIISAAVAVAFVVNAVLTHAIGLNRDRRADYQQINEKIGGLNDKIHSLDVSVHEKINALSTSVDQKINALSTSVNEKIDGLNDKIHSLDVSVSEVRIEVSQMRRDMVKMEERQSKIEKEVDTIRRNSDEQRLQINMFEAHRHFNYSNPNLLENQHKDAT